MELNELKKLVINALEDIKAVNITVLDVAHLTSITDLMIICSASSNRQAKALANNVIDTVKKAGCKPLSVQGEEQGDWILLDLGDIVVHIMQQESRDFYQLEKLWTITSDLREKQQAS